jgi:hypothetical protein
MSKPATNEQGLPVRRGAYDYETRGGKLQDVNQDNQVSFADTWIGDMLGMDGQGGVQGPSMRDSMAGARRRAIEVMQAQGMPMTQANLARAMNAPGGGNAAQPSDIAQPGTVMHEDQPVTTQALDENGNSVAGPLAIAATGAAAAVARKKLMGKPLEVGPDGKLVLPAAGNRGMAAQIEPLRALTPQQAAEQGWAVVGINYPSGSNALPASGRSATPAIDMIDGTAEDVTDVSRSAAQPASTPTPNPSNTRPGAGDAATPTTGPAAAPPESAPISTEEIMGTPRAEGVKEIPNPVSGVNPGKLIDTGMLGPAGEMTFRDAINGGYSAKDANGVWINALTMDALHRALRAVR